MDLDRILHPTKTFGELTDTDLEEFLRNRAFSREHLNLEFKVAFPSVKGGAKPDIREFCKYIAGFSNEEGGIVVYGVADRIKDPAVAFPDYVEGLTYCPTVEDLSQWVTDRVLPLVQSPSIREFGVAGKRVTVLKIPEGANRPYAYVDPSTQSVTFFKKTAGGIKALRPDEIKDLYWNAILEQSTRILRAGAVQGMDVGAMGDHDPFARHRARVVPLLENPRDYGRLGIYCSPLQSVEFSVTVLKEFMERHRNSFSEAMRYAPSVDVFQDGVSAGFFPRAVRQDVKSTARVSIYTDGFAAYDSHVDTSMDRDNLLHPFWLSYEIQRQLQLAKSLLEPRGVQRIRVTLELENVEHFHIAFGTEGRFKRFTSDYAGPHRPIVREIELSRIHSQSGRERNVASPAVVEIMDEIFRIFGMSATPPGTVFEPNGYLHYVRGVEGSR